MSANNITSANATAWIVFTERFPAGFPLDHFATDSAITMDSVQQVENRMGVDGYMSGGFIPNIKTVTINLEAGSLATIALSQVWQAQDKFKTFYNTILTLRVPSISTSYIFRNGNMREGTPLPALESTLAPTTWIFDFEALDIAPIG